jgi:serine phosphatase RsbU (regulator of sigma subunit)
MPFRTQLAGLDRITGPFRRALRYAFYDWTSKMPRSKRILTLAGIILQGYAPYVFLVWSLNAPKLSGYLLVPPKGVAGFLLVYLIYMIGLCLMNGMLTSEFFRKTQLEADQIAARQIQQTLHPQTLEKLPGYEVETFYKPFREVGGDYFDVIELPGNRTLFAVADVSGKGMAAALLAANIQALVRSIANVEPDPLALARQINKHLSRYTPSDRFATAVFIVLRRDSGELTYVNAGHNAPLVSCSGSTTLLGATGIPLGLSADAEYEAGTAVVPPGGALLLYTDGLTDAISGKNPENRLQDALSDNSGRTMAMLKALVDSEFNQDDVTILLVNRAAGTA